jgi:hypothetical protein
MLFQNLQSGSRPTAKIIVAAMAACDVQLRLWCEMHCVKNLTPRSDTGFREERKLQKPLIAVIGVVYR